MTHPDILNSWKEIAAYLGRGVRTVQRWETELRLPVRRPHGRSRSAVTALKSELDAWVQAPGNHKTIPDFRHIAENTLVLRNNRREMSALSLRLRSQMAETRALVRVASALGQMRLRAALDTETKPLNPPGLTERRAASASTPPQVHRSDDAT